MKKINLVISLIFFALALAAQKPEKIYGSARQNKPIAYYKEQAIAWKKEVEKKPKDPEAWYNYFYVYRNLQYKDTTDKRSEEERQAFLDQIVLEMEKNIPDSYEYNMCKWMSGGHNMSLLPYLKKAVAINPSRTEHIDYMINISELDRNLADRNLYSKGKFENGLFSTGIIYYNYNVIAGLDKNAILLSNGDNDTYPIWYLQSIGIRNDVTVINLSLIRLDEYRKKLFTELGIAEWPFPLGPGHVIQDIEKYYKGIIKHIAANKKGYPVYIALTAACDDRFTKSVESKLYLTGLAYRHSDKALDNMAFLKRNVEQFFALDYLDKIFYKDISPDMVKMINGNYIIPLLKVYEHYKLAGEVQKQEWIKKKLLAICEGTEDEKSVKAQLEE